MITERQKSILEKIIEEHITTARPVSSNFLEKKYDFDVCPATIRNEMQKLTEIGFLYQPHTSSGRVPTDKGYRFLVDNLLEQGVNQFSEKVNIHDILAREKEDEIEFFSSLAHFLAMTSSALATIHFANRDFIWKEGWEEILKEPEFEEKESILEFTNFIKDFENDVKNFNINSEIKVFIGRENPFSRAKGFSIISRKCHAPRETVISLLGPKRMSYGKNINLINSIIKALEDF